MAECAGVEPNPRITSVARGAETVRSEGCEMVIALGGGSTMDAAKVIAAAALYDGDPWNLIGHGQENWVIPTQALPIITHVTEGYFNGVDATPIQDRFAEGVILNTIAWGRKAVADRTDLDARTRCSGRLSWR